MVAAGDGVPPRVRVLVVAPQYPSLNQPWIDTYLAGLTEQGIAFTVATPDAGEPAPASGTDHARVVRYATAPGRVVMQLLERPLAGARAAGRTAALFWRQRRFRTFSVPSAVRLAHLVAQDEALDQSDLIHAHDEIAAYQFHLLALATHRPLVLTFHGLPPTGAGQLPERKRRMLYHHAARVFVNTDFARRQVIALGCPADRITVLPQGLPLANFPFAPRRCPETGPLELLTVGRFHPDKGHGYALLACWELVRRGVDVRYRIIGVGRAEDRDRLRALIRRLGLTDRVTLDEGVSPTDLRAAYRAAHLFILPSVRSRDGSHEETQGVVLQEAQASGCIPIATRAGGIPECVADGVDAILVADRSAKELAAAVEGMLRAPDRWAGLQLAGRRNVEARFASDRIAERMASALRAVYRDRSGGAPPTAVPGGYGWRANAS